MFKTLQFCFGGGGSSFHFLHFRLFGVACRMSFPLAGENRLVSKLSFFFSLFFCPHITKANPAELVPTLSACHVHTTSILFNRRSALGAHSRVCPNEEQVFRLGAELFEPGRHFLASGGSVIAHLFVLTNVTPAKCAKTIDGNIDFAVPAHYIVTVVLGTVFPVLPCESILIAQHGAIASNLLCREQIFPHKRRYNAFAALPRTRGEHRIVPALVQPSAQMLDPAIPAKPVAALQTQRIFCGNSRKANAALEILRLGLFHLWIYVQVARSHTFQRLGAIR